MLPPSASTSREGRSAEELAQVEGRRVQIAQTLTQLLASKLVHEFIQKAERQVPPTDLPTSMSAAPIKQQSSSRSPPSTPSSSTTKQRGPCCSIC